VRNPISLEPCNTQPACLHFRRLPLLTSVVSVALFISPANIKAHKITKSLFIHLRHTMPYHAVSRPPLSSATYVRPPLLASFSATRLMLVCVYIRLSLLLSTCTSCLMRRHVVPLSAWPDLLVGL